MTFEFPVVPGDKPFSADSGSFPERLVFNHRRAVLLAGLVATLLLGFQATRLTLRADLPKMIPKGHPFIVNALQYHQDLAGQERIVLLAVETLRGTIFDARYLETLRRINDEVFLIDGVDRPYLKSLWTPSTRWLGLTKDGFTGGPVIPDSYDGSPRSLAQVRRNVARSGEIGRLVAPDDRSSVVVVPLLERNPRTGGPLDLKRFAEAMERVRAKYRSDTIRIHLTGSPIVLGDLINGLQTLWTFFALALAIAAAAFYWYTRCARATLLVALCSLLAVLWMLGILPVLGFALEPYSVLVPFLILAIGMSHGAQMTNAMLRETCRGNHRLAAARYAFRRLFPAGLTALITDALGFVVLLIVPIAAVRELALSASLGVALLVLTNLVLLPVLLSYVGVGRRAAARCPPLEAGEKACSGGWSLLLRFTQARGAGVALVVAMGLAAFGLAAGWRVQVGNLHAGAPEFRPDSRYNRDAAFMAAHYTGTSDLLTVFVETPPLQCARYTVLKKVDALAWTLTRLPGVSRVDSLAGFTKRAEVAFNEGNLRWYGLPQAQPILNELVAGAPSELVNRKCDLSLLHVYLKDHKAGTLRRTVGAVETFATRNDTADLRFSLGAGNAAVEAATNSVVAHTGPWVLGLIYAGVTVLCLVAFRSWRALVCALVPLALTSILCQGWMAALGIGITVATLPVVTLGVGIGVDFALYLLALLLAQRREGAGLRQAYCRALLYTGRVVVLMGITLSAACATWAFSPIKFQADMGVLLALMFLTNMVGTLILVPALASWVWRRLPPA